MRGRVRDRGGCMVHCEVTSCTVLQRLESHESQRQSLTFIIIYLFLSGFLSPRPRPLLSPTAEQPTCRAHRPCKPINSGTSQRRVPVVLSSASTLSAWPSRCPQKPKPLGLVSARPAMKDCMNSSRGRGSQSKPLCGRRVPQTRQASHTVYGWIH